MAEQCTFLAGRKGSESRQKESEQKFLHVKNDTNYYNCDDLHLFCNNSYLSIWSVIILVINSRPILLSLVWLQTELDST